MNDLPDDQLPQEPDSPTVRVMGRGKVHQDYKWIADGLDAVDKTQADLVRYMTKHQIAWDQPILSRQLKGARALKSKEEKLIHKFFAENGYTVSTVSDAGKKKLTVPEEDISRPAESSQDDLEGKVELSIKLVTELQEAVSDLRRRVQYLEQDQRETPALDPKGLRRK